MNKQEIEFQLYIRVIDKFMVSIQHTPPESESKNEFLNATVYF